MFDFSSLNTAILFMFHGCNCTRCSHRMSPEDLFSSAEVRTKGIHSDPLRACYSLLLIYLGIIFFFQYFFLGTTLTLRVSLCHLLTLDKIPIRYRSILLSITYTLLSVTSYVLGFENADTWLGNHTCHYIKLLLSILKKWTLGHF